MVLFTFCDATVKKMFQPVIFISILTIWCKLPYAYRCYNRHHFVWPGYLLCCSLKVRKVMRLLARWLAVAEEQCGAVVEGAWGGGNQIYATLLSFVARVWFKFRSRLFAVCSLSKFFVTLHACPARCISNCACQIRENMANIFVMVCLLAFVTSHVDCFNQWVFFLILTFA